MRARQQTANATNSFNSPAQIAATRVAHQRRVPVVVPFLDNPHPVVNVVDGLRKYPVAAVPGVLRPLPPPSTAVISESAFIIARHLHGHQLVLRIVGEIPLPVERLTVVGQVAVVVVGETAAWAARILVFAVNRERVRSGVVGSLAQVPRSVVSHLAKIT